MNVTFESSIDIIIRLEGGYNDIPQDSGGETKYGITKRTFPNEDIKNLTLERAKFLYKKYFWDKNKIEQYPHFIRLEIFDMAVNSGNINAVKVLQRTLGGLKIDGVYGQKTNLALNQAVVTINDEEKLLYNLTIKRFRFYVNLAIKQPKNTIFLEGWMNRAEKILEESIKML